MKTNSKIKSVLSALLAICMLLSMAPVTTFATQSNEYMDPADIWMTTGSRNNELDSNATVTEETQYCMFCEKETLFIVYRVPEYTKSGESALNRGVKFSDGTCIDGITEGNLDDGLPGVDAYYTGYHWSATRS